MDNKEADREMNIKKYQKSKSGFQCLGPCYHPGTLVVHPTLLELVVDNDKSFCPVNEWQHIDPKTGKKSLELTDGCFNPTEKNSISNKELGMNILTPYIDFNAEHFLKIYYKIFSFEDAMDWLDRSRHTPIDTQTRVVNSALKAFGKSIDLVDNRFISFIIDCIKKRYIKHIYSKCAQYIGVNDSDELVLMDPKKNELDNDQNSVERINYLMQFFLNKDEINKFVIRFFKFRKSDWESYRDFINTMIIDLGNYIETKINLTISQQ